MGLFSSTLRDRMYDPCARLYSVDPLHECLTFSLTEVHDLNQIDLMSTHALRERLNARIKYTLEINAYSSALWPVRVSALLDRAGEQCRDELRFGLSEVL